MDLGWLYEQLSAVCPISRVYVAVEGDPPIVVCADHATAAQIEKMEEVLADWVATGHVTPQVLAEDVKRLPANTKAEIDNLIRAEWLLANPAVARRYALNIRVKQARS